MPQRKNFWLYSYDQVKYRTTIFWGTSLVISLMLAILGGLGAWGLAAAYRSGRGIDTGLAAVIAMVLAMAGIELPAAAVYFLRRWRGEITGYFDYEVLADADIHRTNGVNHGSDHH